MTGRRKRQLTEEDRILWKQVKSLVKPLQERSGQDGAAQGGIDDVPSPRPRQAPPRAAALPAKPFLPPYYPPIAKPAPKPMARIDDVTARKLRKRSLEIDARIDLHGMSQSAAHDSLLHFFRASAAAGDRLVLVITGKGRASEGALRRAVPLWFNEAVFSALVSAWRTAHVSHGGEGALYVRLRKKADPKAARR